MDNEEYIEDTTLKINGCSENECPNCGSANCTFGSFMINKGKTDSYYNGYCNDCGTKFQQSLQ